MNVLLDFVLNEARKGLKALPPHMHEGMMRYIEYGVEPGGFAMAVLANDFKLAAQRADQVNQHFLKEWALYVANDIPANSQGSWEKVKAWCAHGGARGLLKDDNTETEDNGTDDDTETG